MSFTLYSPSMNKLNYPDGLKPLDFLISSIEKERIEESIDGIPGSIDYGFNYKSREITLTFWLKYKHGEHDYHLQKNEINHMLDQFEYFYISNDNVPSRMIRITIDEAYIPERIQMSNSAKLEVSARVSGLPFWRTKYTTQELNDSGYSAIVEKYGMADGVHVDHLKYRYDKNEFTVWNGGNVTVNPRNMDLKIKMYYVKGTGSITNKTTGEKLNIINDWKGNHLTIEGVKIIKATTVNALRDTNREFISLAPGLNEIEVKGLEFTQIEFDFPYYYK